MHSNAYNAMLEKHLCTLVNSQSEIIKDYLKNPLPVTLKTEALVDPIVYPSNFSFLSLSSSFTNLLSIFSPFSCSFCDLFPSSSFQSLRSSYFVPPIQDLPSTVKSPCITSTMTILRFFV